MTAQHHDDDLRDAQLERPDSTDPLGPITLPKRAHVGARAMALVGTVGMSAFALAAVANAGVFSTWPTIEA
ncbi:hypothetical protein E0H73_22930 [Kribbella pittospori]|uniref:Uncharacterized protein n=1 Tax=Kribbella pittospori TaxID=722689 RepID=A0A4R0KG98_9ACTN|nr:hypothetical protein [Kribbella pittospori]TCC59491.1 hypothetical protein E0H73_22930 [Kribbella pittospori]